MEDTTLTVNNADGEKTTFPLHQEFGQIGTRPRELISAVVSGYERHKSVSTLLWARNASGYRVGSDEVIQPGLGCTSWVSSGNSIVSQYDLVNDAQVVDPSVSQSWGQFHLILDPRSRYNLIYWVCVEYEPVSYSWDYCSLLFESCILVDFVMNARAIVGLVWHSWPNTRSLLSHNGWIRSQCLNLLYIRRQETMFTWYSDLKNTF